MNFGHDVEPVRLHNMPGASEAVELVTGRRCGSTVEVPPRSTRLLAWNEGDA